ncbi:MAG TPA: sugar phosphate nucleotidyltransferase [Thermoanaerobaculia bacterium]|nr:sugar phosphate nucleotidyltransferase [Thermoanaerobaculia bacterium]
MRALILAGGKGSRLRPFTFTIPKPLVPIGEMPVLEILIRQLKGQGFARITIAVGHLAGLIRAFCGDGSQWGIPIDYVYEEEPLGTIGCLALLDDLESAGRLLVVNGDTLTDMNMAEAYAAHDGGDAITLCANRRSVDIDFGVLETDGDGRLASYTEKPTLHYRVSMGVNVVSAWTVAKHIRGGERLDVPDLVRRLLAAGEGVRVLEIDAYWLDLGRLNDLEAGYEAFRANPRRFLPE